MRESSSKRRHSTPPSPPKSDPAAKVSFPPKKRPQRKNGRRGPLEEDPEEELSQHHAYLDPATQSQSVAAQPRQEAYPPDSSNKSTSIPARGVIAPPQTQRRKPREMPLAVPQPPQYNTSSQNATLPDPGLMMPLNTQLGTSEAGSLAMPGLAAFPVRNEFDVILDALSLPPFTFPMSVTLQETSPRALQYPSASLGSPIVHHPQTYLSPTLPTMLTGRAYPATSTAIYGQPARAQQFSAASYQPHVQQAPALPERSPQMAQGQVTASQSSPHLHGGIQQINFASSEFMPAGPLQTIDPLAQPGLFFRDPAPLARREVVPERIPSSQQAGAISSAKSPQGVFDLSRDRSDRQARLFSPSAPLADLQYQAPVLPADAGRDAWHSWTAPTVSPPPMVPQQAMLPHQNLATQRPPVPQQGPSQQEAAVTQQITSLRQSLAPQADPQTAATPMNPIEPRIADEQYLWSQLETAQLTMVGTLDDLVARTRNNKLRLNIEERQIRNVTTNLVNVMSLWYLLRKERGWPL